MTTPRQARQKSGNGPRIYAWPPQPPHEFEVISVTSAISGGLPKPFLVGWAAKMAAEFAVDNLGAIAALVDAGQKRAAVDMIKGARYRDMNEKADRGTIVHAAVEAYVAGAPLSEKDIAVRLEEARLPKGIAKAAVPMVQGVLTFLQDAEPEILWSEATVYSRTHGYAGTADLIARMHVGGSRVPVVIDIKTSKAIYDETALQLCAYARADFVGLDDGTEAPVIPDGHTRQWKNGRLDPRGRRWPEYGIVVRPTASGSYEPATFALTDDVFELFLAVLTTARLADVPRRARRPS